MIMSPLEVGQIRPDYYRWVPTMLRRDPRRCIGRIEQEPHEPGSHPPRDTRYKLLWATIVILASVAPGPGIRADEASATDPDCGLNSLFILFQLEGCPVSLGQLDGALPHREPKGYSMAELAQAAASLGLRLEGIDLQGSSRPRDRAVIAHFKHAGEGHFAVLRSVGMTGTMVQVIDPPDHPRIMDFARVTSSPEWTGHVLVPDESRVNRLAAPALLALGGLVCLIASGRFWWRCRDQASANGESHEHRWGGNP